MDEDAQERAQEELLLLRAVADASPDALLVVGADGRERWRNRAARVVVPDGPVGAWSLHRAGDGPLAPHELPHVAALEGRPVHDLRVRFSSSPEAPVLSLSAVPLTGGTAHGTVAVLLRDVTGDWRERAELDLFVSAVAHDLKGPLAAVDGWLAAAEAALADGPAAAADAPAMLARGRAAAARMRDLVEALLAHARAADQEIVPTVVPLARVVDGVVEARGLEAFVVVEGDLPEVVGDEVLLRQVLDNLLANAVAYARDDVPPRVVVRAHHEDGSTVLVVEDNGRGIHRDDLDRVWRPFERAAPDVAGHGLGLPISRTIVERHGGTLLLRSRVGEGTTLEVRLPRHRPASAGDRRTLQRSGA